MSEQQAIELHQRSWTLLSEGRLDEAAHAARQALHLMGESAEVASADVANLLTDLAEIEYQRGQLAAALALAERAQDIEDAWVEQLDGDVATRIRLRTLGILGVICRAQGEYSRAALYLEEAVAMALSEFDEESEEVSIAQNELAVLYKHSGRFDDAKRLYECALQTMLALHGVDSLACAVLYHNVGGLLHARGEFSLAETPARDAWEISRRQLGEDDVRTTLDAVAYGAVLEGLERYEECERIYRAAWPILEREFGEHHVEIAALLHNLGAVIEARGDLEHAELLYRRTLSMREALLGERHPDVALTSNNLGRLLAQRGETDEAQRLLERAVEILQRLGPSHPHLAKAKAHLESARLDGRVG